MPEFTLDGLRAIYDAMFGYLHRTRSSSYILSDHTPFYSSSAGEVDHQSTRQQRERKQAASNGVITSAADLAAVVRADMDILDSMFEEFDVRVASPGKYVHCPFHGPDNHPSMSIFVADDGNILIRDWHDGTNYDIVSLHYALRTGEPGNIDRGSWWQELALIAREHGLIPDEQKTRGRLSQTIQAVHNSSVWEGATPGSVEAIRKCFDVILSECAAFGNLFVSVSARALAEKADVDLKLASRAANFLVMAGVTERSSHICLQIFKCALFDAYIISLTTSFGKTPIIKCSFLILCC